MYIFFWCAYIQCIYVVWLHGMDLVRMDQSRFSSQVGWRTSQHRATWTTKYIEPPSCGMALCIAWMTWMTMETIGNENRAIPNFRAFHFGGGGTAPSSSPHILLVQTRPFLAGKPCWRISLQAIIKTFCRELLCGRMLQKPNYATTAFQKTCSTEVRTRLRCCYAPRDRLGLRPQWQHMWHCANTCWTPQTKKHNEVTWKKEVTSWHWDMPTSTCDRASVCSSSIDLMARPSNE